MGRVGGCITAISAAMTALIPVFRKKSAAEQNSRLLPLPDPRLERPAMVLLPANRAGRSLAVLLPVGSSLVVHLLAAHLLAVQAGQAVRSLAIHLPAVQAGQEALSLAAHLPAVQAGQTVRALPTA